MRLDIFDPSGRRVRQLVDEALPGGWHRAVWDGTDDGQRRVASGIYYASLRAGSVRQTMKLVLLK